MKNKSTLAIISNLPLPRDEVLRHWASATKQVVAMLWMQEIATGHTDRNMPVAGNLSKFVGFSVMFLMLRNLILPKKGIMS